MIPYCLRKLSHIQERRHSNGSEHRNRYRYLRLKQHRRRHYPPENSSARLRSAKWPTDAIPSFRRSSRCQSPIKSWSATSNRCSARQARLYSLPMVARTLRHASSTSAATSVWAAPKPHVAYPPLLRRNPWSVPLPRVWPSSLPPRPDRTCVKGHGHNV